jgi:hypothetical protein
MAELLVDFITSLDGYASAEGWPGERNRVTVHCIHSGDVQRRREPLDAVLPTAKRGAAARLSLYPIATVS